MNISVEFNTDFLSAIGKLQQYELDAVNMFVEGKIDFRHAAQYMDTQWGAEIAEQEQNSGKDYISPIKIMRFFSIVGAVVCKDLYKDGMDD